MSGEKVEPKPPSLFKSFIAGGVGGSCLVLAGHPLDTIKVRIQTDNPKNPQYKGMIDCAQKSIKAEGFRGLYKGMSAPLAGVTPMYALCFLGYGTGKKLFCDDDAFEHLKLGQIAMAGGFSSFFTTPILAPGERLKCVLQVEGQSGKASRFNGPVDVFKHLYKEGGVRSVTRGAAATFWRDAVASAFYFSTYEYLKSKFSGDGGPTVVGTFFAGGFAGILNWAGALPIDTLKTKLQVAPEGMYPNGMRDVLKEILAKEGPMALYRGFIPVMARAFPANAACFLGYEGAIHVMNNLGIE